MQDAICCYQHNNDIYCVINPAISQNQAVPIKNQSLVKCPFCKSICQITEISSIQSCDICKSVISLPKTAQSSSPIPQKDQSQVIIQSIYSTPQKIDKCVQILLVFECGLEEAFINGFVCLVDLLEKYRETRTKIGCIFYDKNIRVIELMEEGRVIVLNPDTIQIINQQFYSISEESIKQLQNHLTNQLKTKSTENVNSSKFISDIISCLNSRTSIIWLGSLSDTSQYHSPQYKSFVETIAFLRIPKIATTMNLSQILPKIQANTSHLFLIPTSQNLLMKNEKSEDEENEIVEQIHYLLYELLDNQTVLNMSVETSREKKHAPYIITKKHQIVGCLHDNLVIRLGSQLLLREKVQVRIIYWDLQTNKKRLLAVNFIAQKKISDSQFINRYIKLFKSIQNYIGTRRISQEMIRSQEQRDIYNFLKQSSLLHSYEIMQNIRRYGVIHMVWPWIGFKAKKHVFVYYLTGYYSKNDEVIDENLERLNGYCNKYYCKRTKYLPMYYKNLLQLDSYPDNSDSQSEGEEQPENRNLFYYQFQII